MERRVSNSAHIDYAVLQQHFHLPISQVAKELGVCATVLKKLCRQHGIPRWPHRKIKSLNKMIATLEETKTETEDEEQQRLTELRALQKKKEEIINNPGIIGPTYSHISPRNDGKPLSAIAKYGRSSTQESIIREQNVMAILHKQRKYSAPSSSIYESRMHFQTNGSPNSGILNQSEQFIPSLNRGGGVSPRLPELPPPSTSVRSSCPAVLEGISTEQLQSLYSAYSSRQEENDFRNVNEEDRTSPPSHMNNSHNGVSTIKYSESPPPTRNHNHNQNFNYLPQQNYHPEPSKVLPRDSPFQDSNYNHNQNHQFTSYPPAPHPPVQQGFQGHQVYSYPTFEQERYQQPHQNNGRMPSNTIQSFSNSSSREYIPTEQSTSPQFDFVPPENYPNHNTRSQITFSTYPNA